MTVKVTLSQGALKKIAEAAFFASKATVQQLRTEVETAQVMPFDVGTMQNDDTDTHVRRDGETITASLATSNAYARRLYFSPGAGEKEYDFQTVNNPSAQKAWLEPWLTGNEMDFVPETFAKEFQERIAP